jgi:hypothetical protein
MEGLIAHVLIQKCQFHIQMPDNEIESPVSGGIGGVGAHSSLELAIRADGHACNVSHLTKRAVAIIVKQEIGHVVVSDEDVLPTVVVVIKSYDAQTVAALLPDS